MRKDASGDGNDDIRAAISILIDSEKLSNTALRERYPDLPHLTSKAVNGAHGLLDYINEQLAVRNFDQDSKLPLSKIATISKTLPLTRNKLTRLIDPSEEERRGSPSPPTTDRRKMTDIIHNFWFDKWSHRHIKDPTPLFRAFGRKITCAPTTITLDSFTQAISSTAKKDSAPGPDGIPFQVYAKIADTAAPILLSCFRLLQRDGSAPDSFNEGHLYLLPKVPTDRIEDTRPLVVNNTDNRIISTVLNNSITPAINTVVSPFQTGFRKGLLSSVEDNIAFFNEKFYLARDEGSVYDILFIDFKKAFDSVAHEAVFKILEEVGFDTGYINAIKGLFHNAHCYTTADPAYSRRIDFKAGIKQGCPLSPTLFILVVEVLLDMLHATTGSDVRFYADDAAVGDDDLIPKLPTIRSCLQVFGEHTGLFINLPKTVAITTGVAEELRSGLDAVGWHDVLVVGSTKYLGIPIGYHATLFDVFEGPYQKFFARYLAFLHCKRSYSLPKRVLIWNTWLLPIFNYVTKFFLLPSDYQKLIDQACIHFVGSTTIKSLHLSRPSWLCGLKVPLRDSSKANLAALISRADRLPFCHDNCSDTMRIRSQRYQAVDLAKKLYGVHIEGGTTAASAYRTIHYSPASIREYYPYLRERLAAVNIRDHRFDTFLENYRKMPYWLPDYCSFALLRLAHNMLPTDSKFSDVPPRCHLCDRPGSSDSVKHLFNDCTITSQVLRSLHTMLGWARSDVGRIGWLCADRQLDPAAMAVCCILINSVWFARCNAARGGGSNHVSWIIADCLGRAHKIHDRIFVANFPGNKVPNRYKIAYKRASKRKTCFDLDPAPLQTTVNNHLLNLPPNTLAVFTDGSAIRNPGPTGAGAAFFNSSHPTVATHQIWAALGTATNNGGELVAVALAVEVADAARYTGQLHIYTDSKLIKNSLTINTPAGADNNALLTRAKTTLTAYRNRHNSNSIHLHYVDAHCDIMQNELADSLAGRGSKASARLPLSHFNLSNFANSNRQFISLAQCRKYPALKHLLPIYDG
jgi:ribonuclease HI